MTRYSCNLRDVILEREKTNVATPLRTVCQHALDVATGLAFIHERNIIHRDLKTENIYAIMDDGTNQIQDLAIGDFDVSVRLSNRIRAKSTGILLTFFLTKMETSYK